MIPSQTVGAQTDVAGLCPDDHNRQAVVCGVLSGLVEHVSGQGRRWATATLSDGTAKARLLLVPDLFGTGVPVGVRVVVAATVNAWPAGRPYGAPALVLHAAQMWVLS